MTDLITRESELVALEAALASNCVPCIEYHIQQARKSGLTDPEIHAAIQLADKVRQVPAGKVLRAAMNLLSHAAGCPSGNGSAGLTGGSKCAAESSDDVKVGANETIECMAAMMSDMISSCDQFATSDGKRNALLPKSESSAPEAGRGCC